jgi:hypothetical protein
MLGVDTQQQVDSGIHYFDTKKLLPENHRKI